MTFGQSPIYLYIRFKGSVHLYLVICGGVLLESLILEFNTCTSIRVFKEIILNWNVAELILIYNTNRISKLFICIPYMVFKCRIFNSL